MVARAVNQSRSTFRGARPFNQRTDLYAVGRLLEEAFRPEHHIPFSDTPLLRQVGIFLWTLNYAPTLAEVLEGFVWVEEGKIVGSVSLSVDRGHGDWFYISNVAVKPAYRRHGVARALMQVTLDHIRSQNGKKALLNVRPNNPGAIRLYEDLGFKILEMRGEWSLPVLPLRLAQIAPAELRPLRSSDGRAVSELIRAATPPNVEPYRSQQSVFELTWDDRLVEAITDFLIGQTTRCWALERDGKLAALLLVRGQRLASSHRIVIQVHPDFRGRAEEELVAAALRELTRFPPHEIRADAASTHPELVTALEHQGFRFLNGLTLMELTLS